MIHANASQLLLYHSEYDSQMKMNFFEDELSVGLMFLDAKVVLHVVNTATRFRVATFFDSNGKTYGQTVEGIWLSFAQMSCTV